MSLTFVVCVAGAQSPEERQQRHKKYGKEIAE
jgi:hypothetical protein